MNKKSHLSAFLTVILISGLVLAGAMRFGTVQASTGASGISKPSVPEFTVSQVDRSYDVPVTITYSPDPFTGQQVEHRSGGYHVQNKTIDITIKNQPFTSTVLENGSVIKLYYCVRAKGHFGDWSDTSSANGYVFKRVLASTADCTVVTLILTSQYWEIPDSAQPDLNIPEGGQEDFQVKAQAGYEYPYGRSGVIFGIEFETIEESSWSSTQTLTIGKSQTPTPSLSPSPTATSSPAPTPTPTPSEEPPQTEQIEPIVGAAVVVAVIVVGAGLLIYLVKRK